MATTMIARYREHISAAVGSLQPEMARVGAGNSGALGNDGHRMGYHLSPARLRGTGQGSDYSLAGRRNQVLDSRAGACQDIGMGWPASRRWLAWLREQRAADLITDIAEIIGSVNGHTALYAADSTGWRWQTYTGDGHVAWSHVAHYRDATFHTAFGDQVLGGWDAEGLIEIEHTAEPTTLMIGAGMAFLYRYADMKSAPRLGVPPSGDYPLPANQTVRGEVQKALAAAGLGVPAPVWSDAMTYIQTLSTTGKVPE